jgi:putative nucleotidyltransferase with HDIG domain
MNSTSRPNLVKAYVSAVIVIAAVGLLLSFWLDSSLPTGAPSGAAGVVAFAALGLLLQVAEHRLTVGSAGGSIAFILYLASALVFGRTWGAAITGVSLGFAQVLARRRPLRIAFNVAQHVLAILIAATVYESLGGQFSPGTLDTSLVPFAAMVIAFFTLNSTAVSAVIALSEGQRFEEVWLRNTGDLVGYDLVASALALGIAWLYMREGIVVLAFVVLPVLFLRHTYLVNVQLQATNRELLELMVKAIEARDPYTSGHSQRVSEMARTLAREMGLHLKEADNIATAALLHDVGKIYEEFAPLLRKEGKLTPEERQIMHSHPARSAELVGTISNLRGYVHKCVRHHHENLDGTGYPDGLAGEQIPIGSRIILVADTTDAMTTDRPYRKALTYERVVEELDKFAGRQFDPRVVAAFKRSAMVRRLVAAGPQAQEAPVFAQAGRRGQLAAR